MKKLLIHLIPIVIGLFILNSAYCIEPYKFTMADLETMKAEVDDPAPMYKKVDYYKAIIPHEVYEKLVFNVDEMKQLWSEIRGFKAPDVVGKVAPEIKPGKYTLADKERLPFKDLMPEHLYNKFNEPGKGPAGYSKVAGNFTEIEIVPSRQYYRPLPLAKAAKKNMGTVQQDEAGYIKLETYKEGIAFPNPSGPHKAMQILYNWTMGLYGWTNWESYVCVNRTRGMNGDFVLDTEGKGNYPLITLAGRVHFEPLGWFDKRAEKQQELWSSFYEAIAPRDIYGNIYFGSAFLPPDKDNISLAYINTLRRIRKLSSSDRQDQAVGEDGCYDDTYGFSQKMSPSMYPYEYKIIEETEKLMPVLTLEGDYYFNSKEKYKFEGLKLERRPVWVLELKQKDPDYIYGRRVIYVDQETLIPTVFEMYDQKDRLHRAQIYLYGFIPDMGAIVQDFAILEDHINFHTTMGTSFGYPQPYLDRSDVSLKGAMMSK